MTDELELYDLDKHRLDDEWVNHDRYYRQGSDKAVETRRVAAELKGELKTEEAELKLVEAQMRLEIKRNPLAYGFDGGKAPTVDDIAAAIIVSAEFQAAQKKVLALQRRIVGADHDKDVHEQHLKVLDNRKAALQDLLQLFLRELYAAPRLPKEAEADAKEHVRKVESVAAFGGKSTRKGPKKSNDI